MQVTTLTDEQAALQEVSREVLENEAGAARVRALTEAETPFDTKLWATTAEIGWHGLEVPEPHGGSGQTFHEVALVLRELGRAATPGPYLSHWLATAGLVAAIDSSAAADWLPRLTSGDAIGAVQLGTMDLYGNRSITITASRATDGIALAGSQADVLDIGLADLVLVAARGEDGPVIVAVDRAASGLRAEWVKTHDRTRRLYDVTFDGVTVSPEALVAEGPLAAATLASLWDRAAVGVALDGVGGAAHLLAITVDYTSQRVQFGRPIATFQAVKHTCADMFVEAEVARIATDAAVLEIVHGGDRQHYWSSVAKFRAGDAYSQVAGDALQMHGGIGMTWEFDLHYWLKRAKLGKALFGSSDAHRARVARLVSSSPAIADTDLG
jgi:alkylation response protein AidB-like acyl-CoA dehydrogenase